MTNIPNLRDGVKHKPGTKFVYTAPEGTQIVSMIEYRGELLVATTHSVFRLINGELVALRFGD